MTRLSAITGIKLTVPKIQQRQRLPRIAYLISQIVGNTAVCINALKMRPKPFRQKPRCNMKVFVVRLGKPAAECLRLHEAWRALWHPIERGQLAPSRLQ